MEINVQHLPPIWQHRLPLDSQRASSPSNAHRVEQKGGGGRGELGEEGIDQSRSDWAASEDSAADELGD